MSKLSGLYLVRFTAKNQQWGEGLVAIADGKANGGDATYLYQGSFDYYGNDLQATIEVKHYNGPRNSVLGPLQSFTLKLAGTLVAEGFDVSGGIPDMPNLQIRIAGRKVAELYK